MCRERCNRKLSAQGFVAHDDAARRTTSTATSFVRSFVPGESRTRRVDDVASAAHSLGVGPASSGKNDCIPRLLSPPPPPLYFLRTSNSSKNSLVI